MPGPRVSVCIVTYNHEKYIENALLSALTQRTKFDFEVIVGDDGSTDGTLAAIRRVAERFPNLRVIAHPKNIGVTDNYLSVHDSAQGEYVAHLDGDDFWLPDKLQAQVDVLDARPECAVAWHPLIAFDETGAHYIVGDHGKLLRELLKKPYIELSDALIAYGVTGYHSSCMYRRSARTLFAYSHPFLIDYRLSLSFLESGAGYHMKRPYGCYRAFHDQSATRGGKDFVGPGILRTLREYRRTHPELRRKIAAHTAVTLANRTRFQGRLVNLLFSRLLKRSVASGGSGAATPLYHGNMSLKARLKSQAEYFTNSLRFAEFALEQGTLPPMEEMMIAFRVGSYLSREKSPKPDFFEKRYRPPSLATLR